MADLGAIGADGTTGTGADYNLDSARPAMSLGQLPTTLIGAMQSPLVEAVESVEYPSVLPSPLIDGYGVNPIDRVIRTDMEGGNGRQRRRSMAQADRVNCSSKMSIAEFSDFRAWFDNPAGANGGAAWFTVPLITGATAAGMEYVSAKFAAIWSAEMIGPDEFQVSMQLEVRYA